MLSADYVVVGSGLTGATIARLLHDAGREVIVIERRRHVGGNVHDTVHPSGIRIHTYGPHYFRTSSPRIQAFVTRFASFARYEPRLLSLVGDRYEHWPVTKEYIDSVAGADWGPGHQGTAENFEEASLAQMPAVIYDRFVRGYTEKQWGVPARTLSSDLARRFDVRKDGDTRLCRHAFQGIPTAGYHAWLTAMLAGIPVTLDTEYLARRGDIRHRRRLIFTGSIDAYFGFELGRLQYRGQQRVHTYFADRESLLPCGQVNNPGPDHGRHIRWLEWRHMMEESALRGVSGTVVTTETPIAAIDPDTCEYPFPDQRNRELYAAYARRAATLTDVSICGRLGEYRYYDMDQAIGRAIQIAGRMVANHHPPVPVEGT
jgi:UDP-galactopyranose mutase